MIAAAVCVGLRAAPAASQSVLPIEPAEDSTAASTELAEVENRVAALRERNAQWKAKDAEYRQIWEESAARSQALEEEIAELSARQAIKVPADASSEELDARVLEAEQDLTLARREAMNLDLAATLRAERRKKLPELLAQAKSKLSELEMAAPRPPGDDPERIAALATLEDLEQEVLESEIAAYQSELTSYEARGRLLNKQRDRATLRVLYYEALASKLRKAAKERERLEVARDAETAERMIEELESSPPNFKNRVREIAGENEQLTRMWTGEAGLVDQIDDVSDKLTRADRKVADLEAELARLSARVEAVGLADSVGVLLRQHRAEAPDVGMYRRFIRMRQDRIGAVQLEQIKLREQRQGLADIDAFVAAAMGSISEPIGPQERADLEDLLRQLFRAQRKYLDALMADYETYFQKLVDFDARQQELIDRTQALLDFIDERILWVPSGSPLGVDSLAHIDDAFGWLFGPVYLTQLGHAVQDAAGRGWFAHLLVLLFALSFPLASRRIRKRIERCGEEASDPSCERYGPTLEALGLTLVLAVWLPAVLAYLGWRIGMSPVATLYSRSFASSLVVVAALWVTIAVPRQLVRKGGLAETHFGWPAESTRRLFRHLAWLGAVLAPATFFVFEFEAHGEEQWRGSLGRVLFLVAMVAVAIFNYLEFRKGSALYAALPHGSATRTLLSRLGQVFAVAVPAALIWVAVRGFYWTALQFAIRAHLSLAFAFALIVVVSLFARWSLISARRSESQDDEPDFVDTSGESGLPISRLMVGTAALVGLFGVLAIWADLLPAARILEQVELWTVSKPVTITELDPSGAEQIHTEQRQVAITLADVFRGLLVGLLTIALIQNLPSLLEATVFRKLGAGERYAYATIVKYAVALAGLAMAFDSIGVGWSSIQWLVAAVGLGLGFGLQEIFANFVSGLIILLERPIRVGDTVTVGDVSGTVTKIRIRATAITSFDRKELVVPNKSFVTDQLVNWTLSDSVLRVDVPVGIAYGSDTEKAIEVLTEVAANNLRVLRNPSPQVLFLGFGDSALSFELRVFVTRVSTVLPVRHELHMAIDKAFREANIEIAFPQQDLHLRTLPDNWQALAGAKPARSVSS